MAGQEPQSILLVDDEPRVVALISAMLSREGFEVVSAGDGEEALRIGADANRRIDLLLTDLVMPQLNGRELADRMQKVRPGIRVLYMSGFMKDALQKYYGVSIAGIPFLQKPFTKDMLNRKVREVLDASVIRSRSASGGGRQA